MARHISIYDPIVILGSYSDVTSLASIIVSGSTTLYPQNSRAFVTGYGEYYLDITETLSQSLPDTIATSGGGGTWKFVKNSLSGTTNNLIQKLANISAGGINLNGYSNVGMTSFYLEGSGQVFGIWAGDGGQINLTGNHYKLVTANYALVDDSTIDIAEYRQNLTTSAATITFTISYTGDDSIIELTLNTTSSLFTFPSESLCVSEGIASGDNTLTLAGAGGDKYIIAIKNMGSTYYIVSKNFGQ